MTEPEWLAANRANWDERVPLHLAGTSAYDLGSLRAGTARFGPIVTDVLGPVAEMKVLHLQCHFGLDTLTLAQLGATATGVDFSAPAIDTARRLADELGLANRTRFVLSDVYDAAAALPKPAGFDRVLVSWGALCWLPDVAAWARVVAGFLRPGGWLALAEVHPAAYVFDSRTAVDGRPGWFMPYFARTPLVEDRTEDYANPAAALRNTRTWEWLHPLSDIFGGLLQAGLRLDRFTEHDCIPWAMFDTLVRGDDGYYRWPDEPWLPLSFSLRAVKPG